MEKPEINLERIHLLIDKLRSQVSVNSGAEHLLPTAQMLVAELQQIQGTQRPRPSVSVIMPIGAGKFTEAAPESDPFREAATAEKGKVQPAQSEPPASFQLQPPIIITERPPEQVIDESSFSTAIPPVPEPDTTASASSPIVHPTEQASQDQKLAGPVVPNEVNNLREDSALNSISSSAGSSASSSTPEFPTSIPPDSPEIQQGVPQTDASDTTNSDADSYGTAAQQHPAEQSAAEDTNTDEVFSYPDKNAREQQRHLEFIHENFSAWSDYGIVNEAPTLVQNSALATAQSPREHIDLNTGSSSMRFQDLNDRLKEDHEEWAQKMQSTPIENLSSAIGINDRYLFISELFRGDESMYERTILTLNKFNSYDQAHAWSERELRLKLGWDMNNAITQQFEQLVKRRFLQKA